MRNNEKTKNLAGSRGPSLKFLVLALAAALASVPAGAHDDRILHNLN